MVGGQCSLFKNTKFNAFVGTAYRTPNVDDFAKVRVKTGSTLTVPNVDLGPEKNIQYGIRSTTILMVGVT